MVVKTGMFLGERYEILEKIGAGGMSDVYRARDHRLNRDVAVKVLKQEFNADKNFLSFKISFVNSIQLHIALPKLKIKPARRQAHSGHKPDYEVKGELTVNLLHVSNEIENLVGVSNLVVIPRYNLYESICECDTSLCIED